jgi:hypothetical protein
MAHTPLALGFNPCISVCVLNDLVWHLLNVTLNLCVGELPSDETLSCEEGVLRVDNGLSFRGNTNKSLTVLGEGDDGWSCASSCRREKNIRSL